jgi:hypothetical protein
MYPREMMYNLYSNKIEVAAIYVDNPGIYFSFKNVDCWDESRDAKNYNGPYPVIAHPPCGPWGSLSWNAYLDDKTTGPRAIEQVRKFGGVLEHPANSKLFDFCNVVKPGKNIDSYNGRTIEIDQVWWGNPLRKRTWLYMVGIHFFSIYDYKYVDFDAKPTHVFGHGSGIQGRINRQTKKIRELPGNERAKTPPRLAMWLVELAKSSCLK